ncbi:MAG: hypothetical protein NTX04_00415 [Verrucomicrobia bacterium]|nr:hypothetical protein [Verrucomicrobiota bacterium]
MGDITFTNLTQKVEIGANCYALDLAGKRLVLDSGLHPRIDGDLALPQHRLLPPNSVDAISFPTPTRITSAPSPSSCAATPAPPSS